MRERETTKIRNIFGNRYSGAMGEDMVAASWHAHDYLRTYSPPKKPPSERQKHERAIYRRAVQAWGTLSDRQKEFYRRIADGMSGYNVFVGRYIKAVLAGSEPEVPIPLRYATADGAPVVDGDLVVRMKDQSLFVDSLADGRGEVALTPSDAPYTFLLRRGAREEVIVTVHDPLDTDIPLTLESPGLGIHLVLDVSP